MELDGLITANGASDSTYGAAGGGIQVTTSEITGGAEGVIRANGGSTTQPGAGGRISIATDVNNYTGAVQAQAGMDTNLSDTDTVPGAGTIFWQIADGLGELTVDNGGQESIAAGTTIRSVGQHLIGAVESPVAGQWILTPQIVSFEFTGTLNSAGEPDSIAYHAFELPEDTTLDINLSRENSGTDDWIVIYTDDGALSTDDEVLRYNFYGSRFDATDELAAGSYIVALAAWQTSNDELIDGYLGDAISSRTSQGGYQISLSEQARWSSASDANGGYGLVGRYVSVDSISGESYRIIDNDGLNLTVETESDLSGVVGNTMVGVHRLDRLTVAGGASVSFGGDLVQLTFVESDMVEAGSELSVGAFDGATYSAISATLQAGAITQQRLAGGQDIVLNGGEAVFEAIDVASLRLTNGATLISHSITVDGDFDIENGSQVRLPDDNANLLTSLTISVGDTLYVDSSSSINLDGQGYAGGSGPTPAAADYRCHGGRTVSAIACEAGEFRTVLTAGSGGSDN